ncbi:MAG: nucleotidyl transferase AbiEii/AbiGii toxin family protein [Candidatus Riflebacteria bacterium]|nr:nucleotidyl transferase AbiEii/AbiGii toxin family protein [Candidatus Riflebacteria bacterium]
MNFKNPMQLKSLIKNKAIQSHISPQLVMQNYLLERLLERIATSKYRQNFIIKGGFLISAIVGLNTRTTMDLDTTLTGLSLTEEQLRVIFNEICNQPKEDDLKFKVTTITEIREKDDYPGLRINLLAQYPPINTPLSIDITTGDKITPKAIEFKFPKMFEKGEISCLTYNIETLLAEKLETIVTRSTNTTRPRDYYDVYLISSMQSYNLDLLREAIKNTAKKRNSLEIISNFAPIIEDIKNSQRMKQQWLSYCKQFQYANSIDFQEICDKIEILLNDIFTFTSHPE